MARLREEYWQFRRKPDYNYEPRGFLVPVPVPVPVLVLVLVIGSTPAQIRRWHLRQSLEPVGLRVSLLR